MTTPPTPPQELFFTDDSVRAISIEANAHITNDGTYNDYKSRQIAHLCDDLIIARTAMATWKASHDGCVHDMATLQTTLEETQQKINVLLATIIMLKEQIEVLEGTSPKMHLVRAELLERIHQLEMDEDAKRQKFRQEMIVSGWTPPQTVQA